jgi:perosamine synthetase
VNTETLPVYEPWLTDADVRAVADAIASGWISGGAPLVAELEQRFAEYVGMPYAAAVSSGTLALELALRALGIGPGDEVICPCFSIISCTRAVVAVGAVPVLVDARPGDYNLDLELVPARITPRTKALLYVHTYGYPVVPEDVVRLAERHRLLVVEDAAEAHGAEAELDSRFRRCGSFGDVSIFSFYANKAITCGEGGMVLARSAETASRVKSLRNLGFGSEQRFLHEALGTVARLSGIQAALGLSQLARVSEIISRKRELADVYRARLLDLPVELPQVAPGTRPVPWMIALTLADSVVIDASELRQRLAARGIETRGFFTGIHRQPALTALGLFAGEIYPVTERLSRRGLYLPSSPKLSASDVERVCEALSLALRGEV